MQQMSTKKTQLLLLEDVDGLGRSGDVVTAKAGFIRNFLLPKKKAVIADKHTLRMRARLQEEREKQAAVDRKESEALAAQFEGYILQVAVKVDPEGNMYGSVTQHDIAKLLQEKGMPIERKHILLPQALKTIGTHTVNVRLKEGVPASFSLEIIAEGVTTLPGS